MDDIEIKNIEEWCKNKKYIKKICSFNKKMNNESMDQVYKNIKQYKLEKKTEKGLWAILGKKDEIYKCLNVGSSDNINKELKDILDLMRLEPKKISVNTTFTENAFCYEIGKDKTSEKYRAIYREYNDFAFLNIIVDIFAKERGEYDSVNFAEVKFAFLTRALLWNPAPSTYSNGKQNKEREIYQKIKNNEITVNW